MKYIISIFFSLFFFVITLSQDPVEIIIEGNVKDVVQGTSIPNATVRLKLNLETEYKTISDAHGNYKLIALIPQNDVILNLIIKDNMHSEYSVVWDTLISSNLKLIRNIEMEPLRICSDSFLPSPIMFENNLATIPEDSLMYLKEHLMYIKTDLNFTFENKKLEISASSSYNEARKISKQRLQYIYELAIESGLKEENIVLNQIGMKPLFLCQYCDGCYYYFLKGGGITLSKDQFNKLNDYAEKENHLKLRRTVILKWIEK